ncbi:MAG: thiamine pyrophosphate-requiring protein [Rhodospirillaceae bacterium]|nr:thiamine pyrophosphate-requiring protein [Rhodospirillaceae bacterium]
MDRGIEHVFVNAGTDWAPIVEAITAARELGLATPNFMLMPHENTAMSMAHGCYLVSGKPQMVGVHNNVGTANALCGLINAARDNIPILLAAGRTPISETGSAASREVMVHWGQENFDQGGMVREHVKWDFELKSGQRVEAVLDRALDITMTQPLGPVYLTLPREVLIETDTEPEVQPRRRSFGATAAQPDITAIERAASLLAAAKNPLIITSVAGRNPDNVGRLASLAERFALPVVQHCPRCLNLPSDHPMHLGYQPIRYLESVDVVLVIDSEVPWIRRDTVAPLEARVIHVGVDPLYITYPIRGFEDDLAITGQSAAAIPMLADALARLIDEGDERIATRRLKIAEMRQSLQTEWQETRRIARDKAPIDPAWLATCLDAVIDENTIVVNEVGLQLEQMNFTDPGSLFVGPPVGGLGWSLGAGLGIKLAAPDKDVVVVLGDGTYMFANPTPCHYVSAKQDLPFLTIIINNSGWESVKRAVQNVYPHGKAVKSNDMPLVSLDPTPDFEKVIEASGGYAERVEDPRELQAAFERAIRVVRVERRQAMVNVICQ